MDCNSVDFERLPTMVLEALKALNEDISDVRNEIHSIMMTDAPEREKCEKITKIANENNINVPWSRYFDVLQHLSRNMEDLHDLLVRVKVRIDHPETLSALKKLGLIESVDDARFKLVYNDDE